MSTQENYYEILGVPEDADENTIKKAFRKLAKESHPDTHPGDKEAEQRFKEVNQAYEVLSDKKQREEYDNMLRYGAAGAGFGSGFNQYQYSPGFDDFGGFSSSGYRGGIDIDSIFNDFFGGGATRGRNYEYGQYYQQPVKGPDVEAILTITFREAIEGCEKQIGVPGLDKTVKIKIPQGAKNEAILKIKNKGRPGVNGGEPGDLLVQLNVLSDPVFSREGNNLTYTLPITFAEAALGGEVKAPTFNGSVKLKIPEGTQNGKVFKIPGKGVKSAASGKTGDLLVKVKVEIPVDLNKKAKKAVKKLQKILKKEDKEKEENS